MKSRKVPCRRDLPAGVTLIELLVVIFIMMLITAIAIPVMIPSVKERRLRETSRVITSHFQGSRTRAIQTGRNFGVMIEPQSSMIDAGITLSYVADAEPWSGDFSDSRMHIVGNFPAFNGAFYGYVDNFIDSTGNPRLESGWKGIIRPGDTIQFGNQGTTYLIFSGEPFTDLDGDGIRDTMPAEPYQDLNGSSSYNGPNLLKGLINNDPSVAPFWTIQALTGATPVPNSGFVIDMGTPNVYDPGDTYNGSSFTIFRQPTKTAAHPLQLPNAMAVDLAWSGVPSNGVTALNGLGPITVLFTPTGALSRVYFYQNNRVRSFSPTGPLYLLVGKTEQVGTPADFQDMTNFWVTLHPQTGLITSTEVGADADNNGTITLQESRYFAERAMAMGGR